MLVNFPIFSKTMTFCTTSSLQVHEYLRCTQEDCKIP